MSAMISTSIIKNTITANTFRGRKNTRIDSQGQKTDAYGHIKELERANQPGAKIEYVVLHPTDRNTSPKHLVYVCHGVNRSLDKKSIDQWAKDATANNVIIVLHNYPGYGDATGPATEDQICADALQVLEHTYNMCEKGKEIVLLGNSVG
jgi:acetyl esterase/lipase